jgi:uncharacterized protein (TIGR02118 family)
MIKVSVLYPNEKRKKFDMDYYCNNHIPMVQEKLGAACKGAAIYKGLGGGEPGSPPTYIAMLHLSFDSIEAFQTSYAPHAKIIMADLPNYTDILPVSQISEEVI